MVYGIGEITYEELSPELQARIDSTSGGSAIAGMMVIDGVFTKKVVATEEEQTEFVIPFSDYDSLNSHLDIKINSTWVNPERYELTGNRIVLNDGVEIGTSVFFTLFSLAEPTGDGGFIEDVEIAETPQEIIVYDGGIIDEKVSTHDVSPEAHKDIRSIVDLIVNDRGYVNSKLIENADLDELTANGIYHVSVYDGNTNCPSDNFVGVVFVGSNQWANAFQIALRTYSGTDVQYRFKSPDGWTNWLQLATTDATDALNGKIGALENERGYLVTNSVVTDFNQAIKNGKYVLFTGALNSPVDGTFAIALDVTAQTNDTLTQTGKVLWGTNAECTYTREYRSGEWTKWKQLATTTKMVNLPLLNGWIVNSTQVTISRNGNQVTLQGNIKGGTGTVNTLIFNIPTEYLPSSSVAIHVAEEQGSGLVSILRAGVIDKNLQGLRISSVGGEWVNPININASYTI